MNDQLTMVDVRSAEGPQPVAHDQQSPGLPTRRKSEEELLREGWTRRFVAAPVRLKEAVELYEAIGYEVHLEPLGPEELQAECGDCRLAVALFRVIYTRRS
ncbi:MAG: hypothetical protein ACE5LU_10820 [Anaerolineae bacterium]